ncbi:MAG: metallo-mystery pair system four-Cys motif protein [Myxococcales bacterium]|nr:metallo-mystery pair system four-Cys motif protein [Myxococcales bacterium]
MRLSYFAILALLVVGCDGTENSDLTTVTVDFAAVVGDAPFECGGVYPLGTPEADVTFGDFRLYIHNLEHIDSAGKSVPVTLTKGDFQTDEVAMLDFENGTEECAGNGPTHTRIEGKVPMGTYEGLSFSLGVPFTQNHGNPATAPSPLNLTEMSWAWKNGYKFLRVDAGSSDLAGIRIHLGSTACEVDGRGLTTACDNPNRPKVVLSDFDIAADVVEVNVGALFVDTDPMKNTKDTAVGCMSDPDDPDCAPIFAALGLPFDGVDAPPQTFIRKAP